MNRKLYLKLVISVVLLVCISFLFIFFNFLYPLKYKSVIIKYSSLNSIEPYLVASIINEESSFNKNAVSSKGAVGLMQLMPTTAEWICERLNTIYNKDDLFIPELNIKYGTYYLNYLIKKFKNKDTALVAYNAGEGVVSKWLQDKTISLDGIILNVIPYKESENYLKRINNSFKLYKARF